MHILRQSIVSWTNELLLSSLQCQEVALHLDKSFSQLGFFDVFALSCVCRLKLVNYNLPNIAKMTNFTSTGY